MMKRLSLYAMILVFAVRTSVGICADGQNCNARDQIQGDPTVAVNELVLRNTADSLATAALLTLNGHAADTRIYSLIAQAVTLSPDRSDLAWLAMRLCARVAGCDVQAPEQHLRIADPTNAAGWLGALVRAKATGDALSVDAALKEMGNDRRFDLYWNPLIVATSHALNSVPRFDHSNPGRDDVSEATVRMIGLIGIIAVPDLQAFLRSCSDDALLIPGRRGRCERAAQAFERGDTCIMEGFGLTMEQRLWPQDSLEWRSYAVQHRTLRYRMSVAKSLFARPSDAVVLPNDYLEVLHTHAREQDASLVFLDRSHLPPDPPAQWTDPALLQ